MSSELAKATHARLSQFAICHRSGRIGTNPIDDIVGDRCRD